MYHPCLGKKTFKGYNNWRPLHCNKFYLRVFCAQFARNWRIILCCFSFHSTWKCIYPFFLNKRKFYWFGWICHVAFEKTIGNRDCMYPLRWIVVICWILNSLIFRSKSVIVHSGRVSNVQIQVWFLPHLSVCLWASSSRIASWILSFLSRFNRI